MKRILFGMVIIFLLCSCNKNKSFSLKGEAQGTYYTIIYYDEQRRDLSAQVDSILKDFDQTFSLWEEGSLLNRLNSNQDSEVSPQMAYMIEKSLEMNYFSNGAFDCRIGPLVNAWGFGFKHKQELEDSQIDSFLTIMNSPVFLDTTSNGRIFLRKSNPSTELDFNAVAQGYVVDLIGEYFHSMGIDNFLVDVGGEVITSGIKVDSNRPWVVGIERPSENKYSAPEVQISINLSDMSVVTSGSYRKYYEKSGVRYSHTIDPATGRPVEHSLLSVSVIDSVAWRADALATSFMVMGLEKSLQFIKDHPSIDAVYFIYDENGENRTHYTPGFEKYINK